MFAFGTWFGLIDAVMAYVWTEKNAVRRAQPVSITNTNTKHTDCVGSWALQRTLTDTHGAATDAHLLQLSVLCMNTNMNPARSLHILALGNNPFTCFPEAVEHITGKFQAKDHT